MLNNYPAHIDEKVKASFNQYAEAGMLEMAVSRFFNVTDTNDYSKGYTTVEGGDTVGYFGEEEELKNINPEEGYKAVGVSAEFGGKVTISYKEMLNSKDETTLFNKITEEKIPLQVARMTAFIERKGHELLNDGFDGNTHLAPDGNAIFGSHTWNSTDATFNNRSVGNKVAGTAALEELEEHGGDFTDAFGVEMPLTFKTLIVKTGGSASRGFKKVLEENNGVGLEMIADTTANVNIYKGGRYNLIETPYITSKTAWFAHATNVANSFVMEFVERPNTKERQTRENLTQVYPMAGSFRFGNYLLPIDWFGSDGTAA